jgi:hypothetical protein
MPLQGFPIPTLVALEQSFSFAHREERDEKKAEVLVYPFDMSASSLTPGAGKGAIIDYRFFRLYTADKKEKHTTPCFAVSSV